MKPCSTSILPSRTSSCSPAKTSPATNSSSPISFPGQVDDVTAAEHVEQWQNLYEDTYADPSPETDLTFDITGWNSSYTGQPIPSDEMAEWVDGTVADIRRLHPERVLEIGCGTGLLLGRLAPDCVEYWGTDYAEQVIRRAQRLCTAVPSLNHVQLSRRMADDFSGIPTGHFDCVILNSIVQYFPDVDYLLDVLAGAVRSLRPGGAIYVGDVRNLQLLPAYHAAVQLHQAGDDLPLAQLQAQIQQHLRDEEELLIDPDFFYALPQRFPEIDSVDVHLKRGSYHNELTQFRYQVVLHLAQPDDVHRAAQHRGTPHLARSALGRGCEHAGCLARTTATAYAGQARRRVGGAQHSECTRPCLCPGAG